MCVSVCVCLFIMTFLYTFWSCIDNSVKITTLVYFCCYNTVIWHLLVLWTSHPGKGDRAKGELCSAGHDGRSGSGPESGGCGLQDLLSGPAAWGGRPAQGVSPLFLQVKHPSLHLKSLKCPPLHVYFSPP